MQPASVVHTAIAVIPFVVMASLRTGEMALKREKTNRINNHMSGNVRRVSDGKDDGVP
jgi:hypothetical protein